MYDPVQNRVGVDLSAKPLATALLLELGEGDYRGRTEQQYSSGWTAVLIHNMGGAERARTHTTAATELWVYTQFN